MVRLSAPGHHAVLRTPVGALSSCLGCRLKAPVAPNVNYFGQVVGNAFAIAVVGYAICISLGKIFALKHGYKVDSNQVMLRHSGPLPWV